MKDDSKHPSDVVVVVVVVAVVEVLFVNDVAVQKAAAARAAAVVDAAGHVDHVQDGTRCAGLGTLVGTQAAASRAVDVSSAAPAAAMPDVQSEASLPRDWLRSDVPSLVDCC